MALALRPAVLLIGLASLLFLLAGALDTLSGCSQTGGTLRCGEITYSAIESYAFGAVNLLVAVLIARGNERILAVRIGLAAFFVVERPVSAIAFGSKPLDIVAIHVLTALVEAVILVSTLRIWRLGHSVSASDLEMLALDAEPLVPAASVPADVAPRPATPPSQEIRETARESATLASTPRQKAAPTAAVRASGATVGRLAILLAIVLAADSVAAAAAPGAALDIGSASWLGAVLGLVVLAASIPAVHGRPLALRLLLVLSLLTFVERVFSPLAIGVAGAPTLLLHGVAALIALVLAVASTAALRSVRRRAPVPA